MNEIEADSFNIKNLKYNCVHQKRNGIALRFLSVLAHIPKVRGLLLKLFLERIMISLALQYDIIDIHAFGSVYEKIIPQLIHASKKVKITIWGSEFYRASSERIERKRSVFGMVDAIGVASERMKSDFLEEYPECEPKMKMSHFGISLFEDIRELDSENKHQLYRKEFAVPADRMVITCGYNGARGQQHVKILDTISQLSAVHKNRIFLLVPMTYGAEKKYLNEVKTCLVSTGIPYTLLTSSLNNTEIAKSRVITDIAVNIQITDARSASIQEHIFAGNVLIAGEWLPYEYMKESGIYFIETSKDDLLVKIEHCLESFDVYKQRTANNQKIIDGIASWENSIKKWVEIYNDLFSE